MKKIFLLLGLIVLTSGIVFASEFEPFEGIKKGIYHCGTCTISLLKDGGMEMRNCPFGISQEGSEATLIKSGKCSYAVDTSKYYSCQYKSGSCSVRIGNANNDTSASCDGDVDMDRALSDAKAGRCYKN